MIKMASYIYPGKYSMTEMKGLIKKALRVYIDAIRQGTWILASLMI